jgi:hypothetical protein
MGPSVVGPRKCTGGIGQKARGLSGQRSAPRVRRAFALRRVRGRPRIGTMEGISDADARLGEVGDRLDQ